VHVIRPPATTARSASSNWAVPLSVAGAVAVALVASVPGSPFLPVLPAGSGPSGPFAAVARAIALTSVHGNALVAVGVGAVGLSAVAFLLVLRAAWRGELSMRTVVALVIAYHAIVLLLPLVFSRDVYSYAMYGRIAGVYHANPYVRTPSDFPADPFTSLVGQKWISTPAVYGPLFTSLSAWLAAAGSSIGGTIVAFRLLAVASSLATVAIVASVARRVSPARAVFAVAAVGMNPVVVFQSVASGHNDLLVALSVAGAFALVVARRELLAVIALSLGALVKATAAVPLVLLLVFIVARRPRGERLRAGLLHVGIAVALGLAFAAPFFTRSDPTLGMSELAKHEGWLAPSRFFRRLFDALSGNTLGFVARCAFGVLLVIAIAALCVAVWRRTREGAGVEELGAAWGWGLLLLMLLGPVLLPWYVTWALPLAWLLPRMPRAVLIGVSTALAISQWTTEPARYAGAYSTNIVVGHYVITPLVIGLLVWLLADLWRRTRRGTPLGDESDQVAAPAGQQ
jgi:hypothetical protein